MSPAVVPSQREGGMEREWIRCMGLLTPGEVELVSTAWLSLCIGSLLSDTDNTFLHFRWEIVIV